MGTPKRPSKAAFAAMEALRDQLGADVADAVVTASSDAALAPHREVLAYEAAVAQAKVASQLSDLDESVQAALDLLARAPEQVRALVESEGVDIGAALSEAEALRSLVLKADSGSARTGTHGKVSSVVRAWKPLAGLAPHFVALRGYGAHNDGEPQPTSKVWAVYPPASEQEAGIFAWFRTKKLELGLASSPSEAFNRQGQFRGRAGQSGTGASGSVMEAIKSLYGLEHDDYSAFVVQASLLDTAVPDLATLKTLSMDKVAALFREVVI